MTSKSFIFHLLIFLGIMILGTFSTVQANYEPQSSVPGYDCYRDSASINQSLQNLSSQYPDLVQISTIGYSLENRPIQLLKLTNQSINEFKPRLVLVSGLRANAFAPVELSLRFAEEVLANYGKNSDNGWLIDHLELHMIILANPDGRARAEAQALAGDDITWQNNTHNMCSGQDIGVRVNHNFPYEWRASDVGACDPAFSGQTAASEPETQAIMSYLTELAAQPEPILLLHLDSYQNEILSPFLSDSLAENLHIEELYTLAEKIGYNTLSRPVRQGDLNYQQSYGTLVDYTYGTLDIPSLVFSMGLLQAGGYTSHCWYFEGDEYFKEPLVKRNIPALFRALKIAADPYRQAYGPEFENLVVSQNFNGIIIEGSANDFTAWFERADISSQVKEIKFFIDLPPWHPQAIPYTIPSLTQDPLRDYVSHFTYEIDYDLLSPGDHRIFFQAWDTEANGYASNPGLVEAIDVFIPFQYFIPLVSRE